MFEHNEGRSYKLFLRDHFGSAKKDPRRFMYHKFPDAFFELDEELGKRWNAGRGMEPKMAISQQDRKDKSSAGKQVHQEGFQ